MKKIICLVLSLIMSLSCLTVAFGEDKTTVYSGLYSKNANTLATASDVEISVIPSKAVKYDKTTGNVVKMGNVEYVIIDDETYKFVNTLADCDVVLYKDAAMKQVKFYLAEIFDPYYVEGIAFTNFGEKCDQVAYEAEDGMKYYTVKGDTVFTVYAEEKVAPEFNVMIGGKLVGVKAVAGGVDVVAHTAVYEWKDGELISIECGICGVKAIKAPNALSIPKGAIVIDGNWYWPVVTTPANDATIESPKTFDAGIAGYITLTLASTTGMAWVAKKKKN